MRYWSGDKSFEFIANGKSYVGDDALKAMTISFLKEQALDEVRNKREKESWSKYYDETRARADKEFYEWDAPHAERRGYPKK